MAARAAWQAVAANATAAQCQLHQRHGTAGTSTTAFNESND